MNGQKTTNILLLLIALPIVFYTLQSLAFIFIPLVSSMFIALFFLPIMRWMKKKNVPKSVSIVGNAYTLELSSEIHFKG